MTGGRFGISTHLFHGQRLTREHLVQVAAHGFQSIELFATRSHVDYRSEQAIAQLSEWMSGTGLRLHSVHAPIADAMKGGALIGTYSLAAGDDARRLAAMAEAEAALDIARTIPFSYLVVHLGVPSAAQGAAGDNQAEAARRSVDALVERAGSVNVTLALEVIPNALSTPAALIRLIDDDLDGIGAGVCLDLGHAHLMDDVGETIETLGGHLATTHVHDNVGTRDEHRVPYAGDIDWDLAMMEMQKIGYEGMLMLEVAGDGDVVETLRRCVEARERLVQAQDWSLGSFSVDASAS